MSTYTERLMLAMECRGLKPHSDQTHLAKRVGKPCKPQNIQHLLDPKNNVKSSKYTPILASVLRCDALWLATGKGTPPQPRDDALDLHAANVTAIGAQGCAEPLPTAPYWPWSVSATRIKSLPPELIGRIDGYIESRVEDYERTNPTRQAHAAA